MTLRSNDLRFAFIAFVAVVGMLSFGGDATAQSTTSAALRAARSCCSSRVCPVGCSRAPQDGVASRHKRPTSQFAAGPIDAPTFFLHVQSG